jgi:hypothetical protein
VDTRVFSSVTHALNLLVKDVFAATKTKQNQLPMPEFPYGYPFEPALLNVVSECKMVVNFFHNHHSI